MNVINGSNLISRNISRMDFNPHLHNSLRYRCGRVVKLSKLNRLLLNTLPVKGKESVF